MCVARENFVGSDPYNQDFRDPNGMMLNIEGENKFYRATEEVGELVAQIRKNKDRILSINLSGNVFEPEPMEALFKEISQLKKLRSATLVGIFSTLQGEVMKQCVSILSKYLPTDRLEVLDLSDNALSCNLPEVFRDFIKRLRSLRVLKINNCGLGELGGNWLAESLSMMETKNSLEAIEIAQNKFINFPKKLGVALEQFPYLEVVKIQYNTIDQDSLDAFLRSFENHSLRILDVRDNFLSVEGCKMLGKFFVEWDIEEMMLGDCLMGTAGLKALLQHASAKKTIPRLHGSFGKSKNRLALDLSFNEICQEGIEDLLEFFRTHDVGVLSIQGNEYEDCSKLQELLAAKESKLVHDYEEEDTAIGDTEASLINKFERAL